MDVNIIHYIHFQWYISASSNMFIDKYFKRCNSTMKSLNYLDCRDEIPEGNCSDKR